MALKFSRSEILAPTEQRIMQFMRADAARAHRPMPLYNKQNFALIARTPSGEPAGYCCGYTAWNDLFIAMLSANPQLRVPGTGTQLLRAAEQLARSRGCDHVSLYTFGWQAKPFYEKLGYHLAGTQEEHVGGYAKYYMARRLPILNQNSATHTTQPKDQNVAIIVAPHEYDETLRMADMWLNETTKCDTKGKVPLYDMVEFALDCLCKDTESKTVGGVLYETCWRNVDIDHLAVDPAMHGRGIGRAMIQHMEQVAHDAGCTRISVQAIGDKARSFYEARGFSVFAKHDNVPSGFTRYLLQKWLTKF